ncbi:MAG TPA: uroporphyrinogen-III synthase [Sphingomicrobium sp.]|nr:uroporphyrinogen-III synthase [Sphingomicrobium sp.]
MRRLVVLRPEPAAGETVARARRIGIEAIAIPLFRVEPIAWQAPEPSRFDALLVTSASAIRHGGDSLRALRGLPVHAVGEATAEAARDAGFDIASTGDCGIERLLGSIDSNLRLLHLCGEHRRPADNARQEIVAVPVYRSATIAAPADFKSVEGAVVAVHSPRAGERLGELVEATGLNRSTIKIAAISEAAAAAAGAGWKQVEASEKPADASLLALAARLCDKGGGE